jgi:hypothetical protein
MPNQAASNLRVVSISSARANGVVSQRDLARERELGRAAELAASEHSAHLTWIQEAVERGAVVEAGPLRATIKTRNFLILNSAPMHGDRKKV